MTKLTQFVQDESGATAIEYGLIAATIGLGILLSLGYVRDGYTGLYKNIASGLNG